MNFTNLNEFGSIVEMVCTVMRIDTIIKNPEGFCLNTLKYVAPGGKAGLYLAGVPVAKATVYYQCGKAYAAITCADGHKENIRNQRASQVELTAGQTGETP